MQSHSITVDGIDMRWEETGAGDPLILIHGIPTCPALWREVAPRIEGRRVLAWEMPGYGASIPEGVDRDISIEAQAEYLVAWMRSLGIERAILAAHDLGGGVAQIVAVRHPEMVAGLLLTNAICYDSWPVPLVDVVAKTGSIAKYAPDGAFHQLLKLMFSKGHETDDAAKAAYDAHGPHYARHGEARPSCGRRSRSTWKTPRPSPINCRSLAFRPASSGVRPTISRRSSMASVWHRILAHHCARIEGGLHFTPEDHPQIIADEINALIRTVATDRSTAIPEESAV